MAKRQLTRSDPTRALLAELPTHVLRIAVLGWVWGLIIYFLAREGALRLQPLVAWWPDLPKYVPRFLLGDPDHPGAYPVILRSLFQGPWRVWWENVPWPQLALATGMIFMYGLVGWLFLDWFEDCMPALPRAAVALTVGCGIIGVAFELVTLAGLLYQAVVPCVWLVILIAVWRIRRRRRARPDPAYPHEDGWFVRVRRRSNALFCFRRSTLAPANLTERVCWWAMWAFTAVISLLVLLHAVGLPETYWDSLILYMGYARMIFQQHSFPVKICGQVGIGLGANYPHLYPLLTAQTATLSGAWHDAYAQLLPAVAGIATVILVYAAVLEFTRDSLLAVSCALLFRAVPYGIAYFQYASDYAVAILFTAAFLYVAGRLIVSGSLSALVLTWLIPAFAVHINYLMWILWPVALLATVLAHVRGGSCERVVGSLAGPAPVSRQDESLEDDWIDGSGVAPMPFDERAWLELHPAERLSAGRFLRSRTFLTVVAVSLAVAAPWYIRNTVLTGNPVYAFFYNIFPSKHVNPAVMKSAELEWRLNGDGLGRVGSTLGQKLTNSWYYFVTGPHHWKLGPVFTAFVLPGFLLFLASLLGRAARSARRRLASQPQEAPAVWDDWTKFSCVAALLFLLLWFYAYCVADMYLYQIIIILPLFAVFTARVFEFCPTMGWRRVLYVATLVTGLAPGVFMGLMGFKLKTSGMLGTQPYSQVTLTALRNLFIDPDLFYRMEFDGDMTMFRQVNSLEPGTVVLTHENRHLLLDPKIRIVHLDDWDVQKAYHKPPADRIRILDSLAVKYYLYIPNEDKHRANSWLGMDELIALGYFAEVFRTESSGSSWRDGLNYRVIPPDKNVLYRRTSKPPS
jgi:hypothetical protein